MLYLVLCPPQSCAQHKVAQHKYVNFHGNKFEMANMPDEFPRRNWTTDFIRSSYWVPTKINGEKIYRDDELHHLDGTTYINDSEMSADSQMEQQILGRLGRIWGRVPDGDYYLSVSNIVTDKKGRICYYEYDDLWGVKIDTNGYDPYRFIYIPQYLELSLEIQKDIGTEVAKIFYNTMFIAPGSVNGRKVFFRYTGDLGDWQVRVIGHKVVSIYCKFCPVLQY